eukprot:SAG22_NODE_4024_length_1417_cov_2.218513_2_plen_75_part_00
MPGNAVRALTGAVPFCELSEKGRLGSTDPLGGGVCRSRYWTVFEKQPFAPWPPCVVSRDNCQVGKDTSQEARHL